jgi:2-oxoglutarate dehydrogenase E2 component (dihydrolipoamide succinyltransferase)
MSIEVRVPALPESVADATVLSWHKKPGDAVRRDENLVDLETDKVVLEVPAPADGVLGGILFKEGDTVQADALLATLGDGAAERETPSARVEKPAAAAAAATEIPAAGGEPVLTPAVRRLIKEFNLDPRDIRGTGREGRILKSDVMSYLDAREPSETDQELSALAPVQ